MDNTKNNNGEYPKNMRTYQDIGRLYGLANEDEKKLGAVVELEVLSTRISQEYKKDMELVRTEVGTLTAAFQDLNDKGIEQLKSLQQNANVALQQFITATEIITKADMKENEQKMALNEVRKASLEIVSKITDSITQNMKTVEQINERLAKSDITKMMIDASKGFLDKRRLINEDLFKLEHGYREGESIRKALAGTVFPPPPEATNGADPVGVLPPSTSAT